MQEQFAINSADSYVYIVRKTAWILFLGLFSIEALFVLMHVLLRYPVLFFSEYIEKVMPADLLYILLIVLLHIVNIHQLIRASLRWMSTYYLIRPKQLVERNGIFNSTELIYSTDGIQNVKVSQSFLGKLLKYGDISVYNPALKKEIIMYDIPNPAKYAGVLMQSYPDSGGVRFIKKGK